MSVWHQAAVVTQTPTAIVASAMLLFRRQQHSRRLIPHLSTVLQLHKQATRHSKRNPPCAKANVVTAMLKPGRRHASARTRPAQGQIGILANVREDYRREVAFPIIIQKIMTASFPTDLKKIRPTSSQANPTGGTNKIGQDSVHYMTGRTKIPTTNSSLKSVSSLHRLRGMGTAMKNPSAASARKMRGSARETISTDCAKMESGWWVSVLINFSIS
mmetsp:Transcript_69170/g.101386  ORF Transcript_69170/g.101386 Transcript_69170/m.101386 type:complete len:216 (-) Transcript_69170:641-1288(-)